MVLIQDRILKIDIYNFEMSYKTPEKSLKSNQIYSVATIGVFLAGTTSQDEANFSPGIPQIPLMVVSAIRIN